MKPLYDFVVYLPKRVKDTVNVGGQEIFLDSKFNEFEHRINYAEIVATPLKYNTGAKVGDMLFIHHHVMDHGGAQCLDYKEHLYKVGYNEGGGFNTQCYAYKSKETGEIHMMTDWIFVEEVEQPKLKSAVIELIETEKVLNRFGRVWCDSQYLNERGVKKGDIVFFEKNADYEMDVDGKKVWRMMFEHLIFIADENYLEVYDR